MPVNMKGPTITKEQVDKWANRLYDNCMEREANQAYCIEELNTLMRIIGFKSDELDRVRAKVLGPIKKYIKSKNPGKFKLKHEKVRLA